MRTVFLALLTLVWSSVSASAGPLDISYTHNTTFAVPEQSYQEARLWFLPDYQDSTFSKRTDTAPSGSGDRNDADYTCEKTYNLNASCTAPQIVEKVHNMGKTVCYKCKCPDNYKTTSCKTGWHLSGTPCKIGTTSYYTGCAVDPCPSGYTAGKTCGSGYTLEKSGQSGDQYCGKCVAKSCPSGYSAGLSNCNGKAYPSGWTYASNGYSGDSICGKCTAKTCSSGTAGLSNCSGKSHPEGWTYSSSGYAGDNVCGTCTAKSCPAGYTAGTTQCSNTTSWTYGSNGYAGDSICGKCTEKGCAEGFTKGLANCNAKAHPAGWSYSTGTPSGSTVCGKCTAKTCTSGTTSCSTGYVGEANGYYSGDSACLTCKVACTPTCPSGWSLTAPTNCKYGGSIKTADSAGCGSSCYRCEAMVATSCQQVIDHANSKYPGKIVLEGYYSCGDKTITLADGQSLVGKSYYTGATENATTKASGLSFSHTTLNTKAITATGGNTILANLKLTATTNKKGYQIMTFAQNTKGNVVKDVYVDYDAKDINSGSWVGDQVLVFSIEGTDAVLDLKGNITIENKEYKDSSLTRASRENYAFSGGSKYDSRATINLSDGTVVTLHMYGLTTLVGFEVANVYMSGNSRIIADTTGSVSSADLIMSDNAYVEARINHSKTLTGSDGLYKVDMNGNASVKLSHYGTPNMGFDQHALNSGAFIMRSANNTITIVEEGSTAYRNKCLYNGTYMCTKGSKLSCKGTTYTCMLTMTEESPRGDTGDVPPSPWFVKAGASQTCDPFFSKGSCPAHGTCNICPINSGYIRILSCDEGWTRDGANCKQTCLYNRTYEPDGYRCDSCKRLGTTYYGGTCRKDCEREMQMNSIKCYDTMDQCMSSGKNQDICYGDMDYCLYQARQNQDKCYNEDNSIEW